MAAGEANIVERLGSRLTVFSKSILVKFRALAGSLVSSRSFVIMLVAVILLYLFDFITLPFWPFTTTGKIYVDSPEVYTRERLVNDRYDQDFWLRAKLAELDKSDSKRFMVATEKKASDFYLGKGSDSGTKALSNAQPVDATSQLLSFEQEFRVTSGIRDMIRQLLLENMLDDRHDLTGNSVYGLKFDTTIIPGRNTRQRAVVHVSLEFDELFPPETKTPCSKSFSANKSCVDSPDRGEPKFEPLAKLKSKLISNLELESKRKWPEIEIDGWMTEELWYYLEGDEDTKKVKQRFKQQEKMYNSWLTDVKKRLNRAEDSVYDSMTADREQDKDKAGWFYDQLTAKTLEIVLGLPEEVFWKYNKSTVNAECDSRPKAIKLPKPWAHFFSVTRNGESFGTEEKTNGDCSRVWFEVNVLIERFIVIKKDYGEYVVNLQKLKHLSRQKIPPKKNQRLLELANESWNLRERSIVKKVLARQKEEMELASINWKKAKKDRELSSKNLEPEHGTLTALGETDDHQNIIFVDEVEKGLRKSMFAEWTPNTLMFRPEIVAKKHAIDRIVCSATKDKGELCEEKVELPITIRSGLLNFIQQMRTRDAYSYAIFPKNDVVGIFSETSERIAASSVDTLLDFARQLSESATSSVLVGYGDGSVQKRGSIGFGWVISDRGDMEPVQKNQLALVSVPAWTDNLKMHVSVGWLDWRGDTKIDEEFDLEIAVPPSLEVFDFIFREDPRFSLGPTIRDNEMDRQVYFRAGKPAKLIIPGSRLWRSATVTLGAQTARKISVLPNMEGIIAEFGPIDPPSAAYNPGVSQVKAQEDAAVHDTEGKERGDKVKVVENCPFNDKWKKLEVRPVRLRVWTSEGVARAKHSVCVVFDPEQFLTKLDGVDGIGDDGQGTVQ